MVNAPGLLGTTWSMLLLGDPSVHVPAAPGRAAPKSISVAVLQLLADKLAGGR